MLFDEGDDLSNAHISSGIFLPFSSVYLLSGIVLFLGGAALYQGLLVRPVIQQTEQIEKKVGEYLSSSDLLPKKGEHLVDTLESIFLACSVRANKLDEGVVTDEKMSTPVVDEKFRTCQPQDALEARVRRAESILCPKVDVLPPNNLRSVTYTVYFNLDGDERRPDFDELHKRIAFCAPLYPEKIESIRYGVYTDRTGNKSINENVAENRLHTLRDEAAQIDQLRGVKELGVIYDIKYEAAGSLRHPNPGERKMELTLIFENR